jgi:putative acetyltransferase
MKIRRSGPTDRETLLDIWLRAVRATHAFLTEDDVQYYLHQMRDGAFTGEVWVLCGDSDDPTGFMALDGGKVESLFLAPEIHRGGHGRRLIEHARRLKGELLVDVNEQNEGACRFYEACGFVLEGRSDVDGSGRPFPILHMRLPRSAERGGR